MRMSDDWQNLSDPSGLARAFSSFAAALGDELLQDVLVNLAVEVRAARGTRELLVVERAVPGGEEEEETEGRTRQRIVGGRTRS